jgi:diaminopimelate epimerase
VLTIASASGNIFAYVWDEDVPANFNGAKWAQALCPKSVGLGLDGLFLLHRPQAGRAWEIEHWEPNGASTFCGNGTRAALAILNPSTEEPLEVRSNGEQVMLRHQKDLVALRLPSGLGFGFRPSPLALEEPHACAWIGNPQLIVEVPSVAEVDLKTFAPPLRHHSGFPEGTNVIVIERLAPGHARIRSWERGVEGETLSCGTGSAVAGAWLAKRTGIGTWHLQPAGTDPVQVDAEILPNGNWGDLWLAGAVRVIGRFLPDDTLRFDC